MSCIGKFKATPTGFTGYIETLRLQVPKIELKSIDGDPAKSQPVYRAFAGRAEIGAGWKKQTRGGVDFVSVTLDDPSFPAPVNARLYKAEVDFDLVWTRPTKRRDEPDTAPEVEAEEPEA